MAPQPTSLRVGRHTLRLSNLSKVLYPRAGFTKGHVIDYYREVAPVILKHLRGRPLTLKRFPDGVENGYFYEKNCPAHKPEWVRTIPLNGRNGRTDYCLVQDKATLIWVANLASLELHTLLSRAPVLDRPTMMVFDLDPGPPAQLQDCLPIALRLREMLQSLGLQSFAKTSGGKGLHVYVPLHTPIRFEQTKEFAYALAMIMERSEGGKVVSSMRKSLRGGKILVDWSQNDQHKTTVCAYSLRAMDRPMVSTPVTWEEVKTALERKNPKILEFTAMDIPGRIRKSGDLFEPVLRLRQELPL